MNKSSPRPTFYIICKLFRISAATLIDIAREAKVDMRAIYALFLDEPLEQSEAERILVSLSRITGQSLTLTTVSVRLIPSKETKDEGD
jgi:hypothetical protein